MKVSLPTPSNHRNALAPVISRKTLRDILTVVEDDVIGTVGTRQCRLFLTRRRADHRGTERLRPLAGDQADAAGRSMDQDGVAGL